MFHLDCGSNRTPLCTANGSKEYMFFGSSGMRMRPKLLIDARDEDFLRSNKSARLMHGLALRYQYALGVDYIIFN